jgi:histidine triad (HIT) family protein
MSSIFTKIIQGELPCFKIHECEHTFSFLALEPIQLGHTLVVPKKEVDHFLDADEESYNAVFRNARLIGKAIHLATQSVRVGTIIQGWEVPHFHYHLVPMYDPSDLTFSKATRRTDIEMQETCDKITTQLKRFL